MPNDTIERGIKKAAGDLNAVNFETVRYEGYGPSGVAIIVDALTDNKNRTAANVRSAFTKGNGSIGQQGCVSYMFDQRGVILVEQEDCKLDEESLMMTALDNGADDFESDDEERYIILTAPESLSSVREALEKEGIEILSSELSMIPQNYVNIEDNEEALNGLNKTLDLLDLEDDVQAVFHNAIGV